MYFLIFCFSFRFCFFNCHIYYKSYIQHYICFALADRFYGLLSVAFSLVGTDFDLLMYCLSYIIFVIYVCMYVYVYVWIYFIFAARFKSGLVSIFVFLFLFLFLFCLKVIPVKSQCWQPQLRQQEQSAVAYCVLVCCCISFVRFLLCAVRCSLLSCLETGNWQLATGDLALGCISCIAMVSLFTFAV